jgi:putative ABC transport system substrate-binding protein
VRRREFIITAGAIAALPLAARAQSMPMRRIGVFAPYSPEDPQGKARLFAFQKGLEHLGWVEGRNATFLYRYAPGAQRALDLAEELIRERPDVILGISPPLLAALKKVAQNSPIPIVFAGISDPIGGGLVSSLARPGGNVTGLLNYEPGVMGKWLGMLKEIAPSLARVAVLGNPKTTLFDYYFNASKSAAGSLSVELVASRVETAGDIERSLETSARAPNSGLVILPDATAILHRDLILRMAETHRLPAIFPFRFFVAAGGLMSYGTIDAVQFRQVSSLVDRILRGAKPGDLPVQTPIKYETVINAKAAKKLGLAIPAGLLVAADEVFE